MKKKNYLSFIKKVKYSSMKTWNEVSLLLLCKVISIVFTALVFVQSQTLSVGFTDSSRLVLAHIEPHGLPDYFKWNSADNYSYYRELFPLEMVRYGETDSPRVNKYKRLKDAGVTCFHILRYDNDDCNFTSEFDRIDQAGGGITVAPCMNVTSEDELVRQLTQYATSAIGRSGAQKIRVGDADKLVISTYWTPSVSIQGWQNARSRLESAGVKLFIIADYGPWGLNVRSDFSEWKNLFESYYFFGSPNPTEYVNTINMMNQIGKSYAGGMMPGTARETDPIAAFFNAQGTAFFRSNWEKHLAANVRWNLINTWNDVVEKTEIRPTSNWNWTRADLNRWYSVKLIGGAKPFTDPKLYITTPQQLHLGETSPAEALVINWSTNPVSVSIQLLASNGTLLGSPTTATIPANSVGAATINCSFSTLPSGRFVRAKATMGATSVTGAPIIVYESSKATDLKLLYYSIPAEKALPGSVQLSFNGNPAISSVSATVDPPMGTTVRFVDLLQNTRQVGILFGSQASYSISAPLNYSCKGEIWQCGQSGTSFSANGFYVGRVIDDLERVGYSDPVFADSGGVILIQRKQDPVHFKLFHRSSTPIKIYNLRGRLVSPLMHRQIQP